MLMQLSAFDVSDALIGMVLVHVKEREHVARSVRLGLCSDSTPFNCARLEQLSSPRGGTLGRAR